MSTVTDNMELCGITPADHRLVHFEIAQSMKEVLTAFEVDIRWSVEREGSVILFTVDW